MDFVLGFIGLVAVVTVAVGAIMFVIYFIVELLDGVKRIKSVERRVFDLQSAVERIEKAGESSTAPKRR